MQEYLERVKVYKDKLEDKQKHTGSNFSKILEYIKGVEFAVFGKFENVMPLKATQISKNLDIATCGKDNEEPPKDAKTTGSGLKIMTPNQLITRLPILLSQVKAGNNSEKLKNEIRQITYSLHRSKNLSKTIYKHLIDNI